MPNWKKLIVSGSDASLNTLFVRNAITASIVSASSGITGSLFGTSSWAQSSSRAISSSLATTASYVTGNIFTSTNPALSSSYSSQSATVFVNTPGGLTTIHGIVMATGSTANAPSILRAETGTTGLRYDLGNNELLVDRLNVRLTSKLSGSLDIVGTGPGTVHTITGSLRVSGSSHIITGSVSISGSLNATSSWATNAITASYVSSSVRFSQSAVADGSITNPFPYVFTQNATLIAANQYLLRASASFISLTAGTYQLYLDFCISGVGQNLRPVLWLTPTVTPGISFAPKVADPNLVAGSLTQGVSYGTSTDSRFICNTNRFTVSSTTQYYIVVQNTFAASAIATYTIPIVIHTTQQDTRTRQYMLYKYD